MNKPKSCISAKVASSRIRMDMCPMLISHDKLACFPEGGVVGSSDLGTFLKSHNCRSYCDNLNLLFDDRRCRGRRLPTETYEARNLEVRSSRKGCQLMFQ